MRGYYLVFVRRGTDHWSRTDLQLRPGFGVRGESDLVEITEEYRVMRGPGSRLAGLAQIVGLLLLGLVVVQVVPVDLTGERDPGEVAQQLVDRPDGIEGKLFSKLKTVAVSLPAGDYKISS